MNYEAMYKMIAAAPIDTIQLVVLVVLEAHSFEKILKAGAYRGPRRTLRGHQKGL